MGEQDPFFRMLTGAEHHHGECQLDFKFLGRKILTCRGLVLVPFPPLQLVLVFTRYSMHSTVRP
eukprot:SAG11_NODE_2423_length_3379_cov_7.970732_1_plen_64_part_00